MTDKPSSAIALTRVPEFMSHMMNMRVFIDGKEIGQVANATRKVFPVEPGNHEVYVRMEMNRFRSEPTPVHVPEGETVELNCGSRFRGLKSIFNIFSRTSLIVREGAVKLENGDRSERQIMKITLAFLFPTILYPITLIHLGFIFLILWLSAGLFAYLFGQHALFFMGLFGIGGLVFLVVVTSISLWKWLMKEYFQRSNDSH